MELTELVGSRGTCNRGRPGCIITKNKRIIATGYVGAPSGLPHCDEVGHLMKKVIHDDGTESMHCVRSVHAEQNAICQAAKMAISVEGGTLYCTLEPCRTCAMMIINCGIKRVVCKKRYHGARETEEMFKKTGVELVVITDEIEEYENQ